MGREGLVVVEAVDEEVAMVLVEAVEEDLVAARQALAGEEEEEEGRDKTLERAEDTAATEATKGGAAVAESPAYPLVTQYAIETNQKGAQAGGKAVGVVEAAAAAAARLAGERRRASLHLAKQRRVLWAHQRPALAVLRGVVALGAVVEEEEEEEEEEAAVATRRIQQLPLSGLAAFVAAPAPDPLPTLQQQERAQLTDRKEEKEAPAPESAAAAAAVFVCRHHPRRNKTPCPLLPPSSSTTCCRSARGYRRVQVHRRHKL